MPATPTGSLSLALHYMRETIAKSETFRTWVGATTGTEAEKRQEAINHLHIAGLPPPAIGGEYTETELSDGDPIASWGPYGIIWLDQDAAGFGFTRDSAGGGDRWAATWKAWIRFVGETDFDEDEPITFSNPIEFAELTFLNTIGGIVDDVRDLAGSSGYANVTRIGKGLGPIRRHPAVQPTQADTMAIDLVFDMEG